MKTARFIQNSGGMGFDCRIADLNSRGARLRFDGYVPAVGEVIEIMLLPETVRVSGKVAWIKENEIGMAFNRPVEFLERSEKALLRS